MKIFCETLEMEFPLPGSVASPVRIKEKIISINLFVGNRMVDLHECVRCIDFCKLDDICS